MASDLWRSASGFTAACAPCGVELADTGQDGDQVERDDGSAGDLPPAWRRLIRVLASMKRNPGRGGERGDSEQRCGKAAVEEGGLKIAVEEVWEAEQSRRKPSISAPIASQRSTRWTRTGRVFRLRDRRDRAETQSSATPSASQPIVIQWPLAFRGIAMVRKTIGERQMHGRGDAGLCGSRIRPRYSAAKRTMTHGSRS